MTSAFDFTLLEIVEMGRTAHLGISPGRARHDREWAMRGPGAAGHRRARRSPLGVSGGERQLALIARALATEATHLLMDEPTANLDFGNQSLILDEVARLKASGTGILFSTHHPDHALRIADRVVMLRGGRCSPKASSAKSHPQNLSRLYGAPDRRAEVTRPTEPAAHCVARSRRL